MSIKKSSLCETRFSHLLASREQVSSDHTMHRNIADLDEKQNDTKEMLNIHKQLQEETENIIRWKASTEIKTKHLERQLQESHNIIEDQRRNLMDLQLHSEHLSQSLLKERQDRELVSAKVTHTRQIFLALQEQYEQLLETTVHFQQQKDFLTSEHKEIINKLSEMQDVCVSHQNCILSITSQAEENITSLEKLKEVMQEQLSAKEKKLADLTEKLNSFKKTVNSLTESLITIEASFTASQNEKISLEIQLEEVKESLTKTQDELKEKTNSLTQKAMNIESELKHEQIRYEESQRGLQEAVEKIKFLKKNNDTVEGARSELADKVAALTIRKQELEQEIVYKAEAINTLECAQLKNLQEINQLQQRVGDLGTQLSDIEADYRNLQLVNENLVGELDNSKICLTDTEKHVKQLEVQVTLLTQTVEHFEQLNEHSRKEKETFQEINQELNKSVELLKGKLSTVDDTLLDMQIKMSSDEEEKAKLHEHIISLEDKYKAYSVELLAKTEKCKKITELVKHLKTEVKELHQKLKSKSKNASQENKIRKKQEETIVALENELQTHIQEIQSLESQVKVQKELLTTLENKSASQEEQLNDSLKTVEKLKLDLDKYISEQQELQYKLESKEESFQLLQTSRDADIERLKNDLIHRQEEYNNSLLFYEKELNNCKTEHDKTIEELNNSFIHEKEIKDNNDSLMNQIKKMELTHKEETEDLKAKMEKALYDQKIAQEEASFKEISQIKLESDQKVNEYLVNEVNSMKADAEKVKMQIINLQGTTARMLESSGNETVFKTPSPTRYFQSTNPPAKPQIPKSPHVQKLQEEHSAPVQQQTSGILKTRRRMLLPPDSKKRVVFVPSAIKHETSGDSSSDAYTFEVADSDDPFEEVRQPGRNLSFNRCGKIPKANIAPIIRPSNKLNFEASKTSVTNDQPASSTFFGHQRWTEETSKKRKKVKVDNQKLNIKTYSSISPRQKKTNSVSEIKPSITE
ncbi:hypothetical protein OTU49_008504 [Cherax quadricarinatus]|uniref:Synaptonemal complex protein 1 n=1 Tax=Cherax quadricarinatus TaxID=27406 RepID=A0AAW0WQG5_CHEQU